MSRHHDPEETHAHILPGYEWPPASTYGRPLPRQNEPPYVPAEQWAAAIYTPEQRSKVEIVLTTVKDCVVIVTCVAILYTLARVYLALHQIGAALQGVTGG